MGVLSFSFLFLFLFQSFLCHEQEKDECIEPQQNENFVGEEVEREKIPQEEEEREEREREEEEKEKEDSFKSGIGRIHWVHECGCTGMHVEGFLFFFVFFSFSFLFFFCFFCFLFFVFCFLFLFFVFCFFFFFLFGFVFLSLFCLKLSFLSSKAMNYIVPLIENGVDVTVNDCDGNYCQESHKVFFFFLV